jgi:mannose-6-phosphate isomerase-like protein (cupin superfamily)
MGISLSSKSRREAKRIPDTQLIVSAAELKNRPPETFPVSPTKASTGELTWHTIFSSSATTTSAMCAGIACCPPLTGHLCAHRHEQAEIYYITEGRGIVTIAGKDSFVSQGSTVFIPGNAEHGIRNESEEDLKWFYVFPTGNFEDVIYRFS